MRRARAQGFGTSNGNVKVILDRVELVDDGGLRPTAEVRVE
jgi:hypothetical protein